MLADRKPVNQRRPVPAVAVGIHEGLVWRATHLVEDVGDKPVALHAGRVATRIPVWPWLVSGVVDALVGGAKVVAVVLVRCELVHNLLARHTYHIADVPAAIGVMQEGNACVACCWRLRQRNPGPTQSKTSSKQLLGNENGCHCEGQNPAPQRAPPCMSRSHVGSASQLVSTNESCARDVPLCAPVIRSPSEFLWSLWFHASSSMRRWAC